MTAQGTRGERGQSSVEFALVLPAVVVLVAVIVQVGVLVRDRLSLVHSTRAVARAVIVEPTHTAARAALQTHGAASPDVRITLAGARRPGGIVTVELTRSPTKVPLVGYLVGGVELRERLVVLVEGRG